MKSIKKGNIYKINNMNLIQNILSDSFSKTNKKLSYIVLKK